MNSLKLFELIGQEIRDLRFHHIPENEYGLQSFNSYIKLADDIIIDIPKFNDDYIQLTEDVNQRFETGAFSNEKIKSHLVGQKIVDFYFCYYNNEVDFDYCAFIKLANGYYLSENNSGPIGLTNIDLIILDEKGFLKRINDLNETGVDVRSFTKTQNR